MLKRRLGRSGIEISAMGLGCYAIGGQFRVESGQEWGWTGVDDSESIRAIHAAFDLGINFLDTAQAYGIGHSENVIGQAIRGRRDQVVIATKFGRVFDYDNKQVTEQQVGPKQLRNSLEESLRHLDTDYVDLFQWHEADGSLEVLPEMLDELDKFVAEGKIRGYGWSTDDAERAAAMAERKNCIAIQHQLHAFSKRENVDALLNLCEAHDLASINRSPLMMGILTGKFSADSKFDEGDVRHSIGFDFTNERFGNILKRVDAVREILTSGGRTAAQGALAWIWARSERAIPIPGFKNVDQATQNAIAMEFGPLTQQQFDEVEAILSTAS